MYIKKQLKKRIFISVISVMVLVVTIIGSSYALFMDVGSNVKDQVMTVGDLQITYLDNSGTISLDNAVPMTDEQAMSQTDNVYEFTIDNTGNLAYQFTIQLANNPEYLPGGLKAVPTNQMLPHEFIRVSFNDGEPQKLSDIENGLVFDGTLSPHTARLYKVRIWIGSGNQEDPTNGLPNSTIGSEIHLNINVDGKATGNLLAQKVMDLALDSEKNSVSNEPATDYRYVGTNPNNYLSFNNELWRIVGVFAENTHGVGSELLVKIYRNESIGNKKWDDNNKANEWSTSTLNKYLNDTYYHSIKSEYQDKIQNVTWHLGGWNTSDVTSTLMYGYERGNSVYVGRAVTSDGYIGLIYPSDYGFSTLVPGCPRTQTLNAYNENKCMSQSWLSKNNQFTLTQTATSDAFVYLIKSTGQLATSDNTTANPVHPVLYLKANTTLNSGTGTVNDPYILG